MSMDHILIVNTGEHSILTLREFVWPIQRALHYPSTVVPLSKLRKKHLKFARLIIFSGCPLADFSYEKHVHSLAWLKKESLPLLGICAGQQILARLFGAKLSARKTPLIGLQPLKSKGTYSFHPDSSSLKAYFLHSKEVPSPRELFPGAHVCFSTPSCPVAGFVHPSKRILGVAFHPEAGQPALLRGFVDWALSSSNSPQ